MLTFIYPFRNRDIKRVENSLNSLQQQSNKKFRVFFVDYGSIDDTSNKIQEILEAYSFVRYRKIYSQYQPWNKCKALNSVILELNNGYCFVADIDIIFHSDFVDTAFNLQDNNTVNYFKVGFLTSKQTSQQRDFQDYKIEFESTHEATGLSMFPVVPLKEVGGFDEFYHFWGAEDTDVHVRLRNHGLKIKFYDKKILLIHQWHKSYRSQEKNVLTENLQIAGIVQLNHQHLIQAITNQSSILEKQKMGVNITENEFNQLENLDVQILKRFNNKEIIDHFLYVELSNLIPGSYHYQIHINPTQKKFYSRLKKYLLKKKDNYYSLKEINDKLLLHVISFYRNYPYIYKVDLSNRFLIFKIIKK